ncbi:putative integral inner membrane protein [Bacillus velezensis AS43.3]|nr:putative integral inner membrane protein [Bacillus velezensis AS43.3]
MERPAGFWIRFLAYVIDQIIIGIPIFIIQFMVSFFICGRRCGG